MTAQRIASLLASGTEILYGLGLGDCVVAVSHECDYPAEVTTKPRVTYANVNAHAASHQIDAEVKAKLARSEPLYRIDTDLLATLRPDLIVTQAQCEVCAVSTADVIRAVEGVASLRTARVVSLNPTTLSAVFDDITQVGNAAGVSERADAYIAELRARIERVRAAASHVAMAERPRVVCIEWIDPVMIAANWMPELIELAGGRCGLTKAGERTTYADWNELLAYDPQTIVIAPCGFDLARTVLESAVLRKHPGWATLNAVREKRVYAADGNAYFNRSGPRLVDTLEMLAAILHPRLFADHAARFAASMQRLP